MSENREAWGPVLGRLERQRVIGRAMGGPERVERQHRAGRMDARQRVEAMCDAGTFVEFGTLVGSYVRGEGAPVPADALVSGSGLIDGRPAIVGAEDFTVMGGSIGAGASGKRNRMCLIATQERIPYVMMLEGAGARMSPGGSRHSPSPNDLELLAQMSGLVPMVCLVMGASAGHGALTAPLSDFVIMVEGSALFSGGPPLVKEAIGEEIDKEALGGTDVHCIQSGVAHNVAADDADAIAMARRYLSYFPSNAWGRPPRLEGGPDQGERRVDELLDIVPPSVNRPYDMRQVVDVIFDEGSVFEVQPAYGASIVTALARLGGEAVAVVANQPSVRAGAVDSAAAIKAAHFLQVAGAFHFPVVFLADNPGVLAGSLSERAGILRNSARMYAAQAQIRAPKLHVTMRKAFGFGSSIMAMNAYDRQTVSYALPVAMMAAMPARGGGIAAKLDAESQAAADQAELEAAFAMADGLSFDELLHPAELRNALLQGLRLARGRDSEPVGPLLRQGIMP